MDQLSLFPAEALPVEESSRVPAHDSGLLEDLTPEQREAVTHGDGPLMIVAGAGTGKTTVLTRRIGHLILSGRARPQDVLALTFTEKAAAEMRERVDLMLPYGYADVQVSTFHSFGNKILRHHGLEIGIQPDFQILSTPEQVLLLREHLFELPLDRYRPLGNPTGHLQAVLSIISKAKDEDVSPEDYLRFAQELETGAADDLEARDRAEAQRELARVYAAYQELMASRGYLDFGDQVFRVLQLLRSRNSILRKLQRKYRYILVDEFQDTNHGQFVLVRFLAAAHRNLTVVGDDDQSIYRFRGAALSNVLQFKEHYPEARQIVLRTNFRSPQAVLDAAYRCVVHNNPHRLEVKDGIDKRLIGVSPPADPMVSPVEFCPFDSVSSEADAVAARIAAWLEEGRYRCSEIAILVRGNRDADPYLRALNMRAIPFRFTGNQGLYSRPEIRLVTSFLRALCNPSDSVSLFHLASGDLYRFPMRTLMLLSSFSTGRNLPLRQAFEQHLPDELAAGERVELDPASQAILEKVLKDLEDYVRLIPQESPGRILYRFITDSGWLKELSSEGSLDGEVKIQNLARFFDILRAFENLFPGAQLPQFLVHLDQLLEAGDSPPVVEADAGEEAVEVLTVHKSKGLEFPAVFLVGLAEGRFPTGARSEPIEFPTELCRAREDPSEDQHLQEERRLFYVAMTRARQHLWLSSPRDTGSGVTRRPSRFVMEALDRPAVDHRVWRASSLEALKRFAPPAAASGEALPPMPPHRILTLSFRKIDDYLNCPLKYKYTQILRVPVQPHHRVVYGNALHEAISHYLRRRLESGGKPCPAEFLLERFQAAWSSQGFLTREHEERRFGEGRKILLEFHRLEETRRAPELVEEEFAFRLDRNRIIGRWDRLDRRHDGAVLVDYKSSPIRGPDEAHRRARESLQLALYASAYQDAYGELPVEVQLYFLESHQVGRARAGELDLGRAAERVRQAAAGIRARDYTPRPAFGACQSCAFREICPATES